MMRPLFLVACLGFSLTNSYLAWAAPDFVGVGVRVPELGLEDALPIALEEIQRQKLTEKYIIRSAQFVAGIERGWEFVLTERRPESKSEPSIWVSTDKKVALHPGR